MKLPGLSFFLYLWSVLILLRSPLFSFYNLIFYNKYIYIYIYIYINFGVIVFLEKYSKNITDWLTNQEIHVVSLPQWEL